MFFIAAFIFLFFFHGSTTAADSTEIELTLSDAIERSLITHPEVVASQKGLQQAAGLLRQAGTRPNPELEVDFGTSSILGDSGDQEWSVAYVHTLELGNKRKKRLTIAELGVLIAKQQLQDRKRRLIFEIKKDFAETLGSKALLEATTRSAELNRKMQELTAARVEQGEAAAVEKDLSEIELSRLEVEEAKTAVELAAAISKLRLSARLSQSEIIKGSFSEALPMESIDLTDLIVLAKERNPQLQIARLEYQQAEAAISLSKAEAVSDLDVFLEYSNEKSRFDAFGFDNNGATVPLNDSDQIISTGISFNLPFSRNQGNIAASTARMEQTKLRVDLLEKTIEQEITNAFRKYEVAKEGYQIYKDSIIKTSEKQIEIMRISFEAGELRFLDWMNEQRRALEIQKDSVLTAKDLFLAAAEVEFVTGSALKSEEGL
jgi:cobalt-zinc-cadmium efflux system outer membrane protein